MKPGMEQSSMPEAIISSATTRSNNVVENHAKRE
jgi:hypothetical protein